MIELLIVIVFYLADTYPQRRLPPKTGRSVARTVGGPGLLRSWRRPQAQEVLREIAHARPAQALPAGYLSKRRGHPTPLLEISPQFDLQLDRRRMIIHRSCSSFLNFVRPELSLVRVRLNVVKNHLLTAIEAHAGNLARRLVKTTAKPSYTDIAF